MAGAGKCSGILDMATSQQWPGIVLTVPACFADTHTSHPRKPPSPCLIIVTGSQHEEHLCNYNHLCSYLPICLQNTVTLTVIGLGCRLLGILLWRACPSTLPTPGSRHSPALLQTTSWMKRLQELERKRMTADCLGRQQEMCTCMTITSATTPHTLCLSSCSAAATAQVTIYILMPDIQAVLPPRLV